VKGRKIHALVDTEGLPMRVVIHSAGMQDRDGAALVLNKIRNRFPWLQLVWADAGYHAHQVDTAVAKIPVLRLEIVKRSDDMKGFVVLPRRWVVERTFSWFGRNRRLAKDFGRDADIFAACLAGGGDGGADGHRFARAFEPDQHRQVDAGDYLHILAFHQADGEVGGRPAEQVRQDDDPVALVAALDRVGDVLPAHFHIVVGIDADAFDGLLRAHDMFHGCDELGRESAVGHQH